MLENFSTLQYKVVFFFFERLISSKFCKDSKYLDKFSQKSANQLVFAKNLQNFLFRKFFRGQISKESFYLTISMKFLTGAIEIHTDL